MTRRRSHAAGALLRLTVLLAGAGQVCAQGTPAARQVLRVETLARWDFDGADKGSWRAVHDMVAAPRGGLLAVESTGDDPYLHSPLIEPVEHADGKAQIVLRVRCATAGPGQVFWTASGAPLWSEPQSARFALEHDRGWHEYTVDLAVSPGELRQLRLDPGAAPGELDIDWIELRCRVEHPLEIVAVRAAGEGVRVAVHNHADQPLRCTVGGKHLAIGPGATVDAEIETARAAAFERLDLAVLADDLPTIRRVVFLHHEELDGDWVTRTSGDVELRCARDGSGARLLLGGELVAVLAPLVHRDSWRTDLELVDDGTSAATGSAGALTWRGADVEVTLAPTDHGSFVCSIHGQHAAGPVWEGPVLRALAPLEQGLFAGLEYLGHGERSSATLDVETAAHDRFAPDPLHLTMPLMACSGASCSVALTWSDMTLQPTFAAPNFVDGTGDQRMALRGARIDAEVLVSRRCLEDVVAAVVGRRGLPPLPDAPRPADAQRALDLAALDGPLRSPDGFGHCAEPQWPRAPWADHASTLWRLTGVVPELPHLVPGGSHVRNDAIWFVTGRAQQWLEVRRAEARALLREQHADGSFRYAGRYARGHFEDTASGYCASRAVALLEFARLTGDGEALAGGLAALDFMRRFRTPRGAQTWEVPLHTPDILASAYLVWAHVRGFELTGRREHLERARHWAASGLPFVYQWSRYPTMAYATVPVYGATDWRAPCWFGLPVQWCGVVYGYALALLAPHADALGMPAGGPEPQPHPQPHPQLHPQPQPDWRRLVRGVLIAGRRMQYPDGDLVGCLPDVFELPSQRRAGPSINPCALVSLELVLDGRLDALSVAVAPAPAPAGEHRVVAPFPVTIEAGSAIVEAVPGARYQVLIDGERIVEVHSVGRDTIPL